MVEGVKDNRLPRATTIIRIILSTVGFIIVSVDFFLAKRVGVGICHAESCRIVANSPFAYLIGIPLPMWGMIFFGSLIFTSFTQTIFYKLLLLGVGAALYFVFLQFFVIGSICSFCIYTEIIVLLLFLINLREIKKSAQFVFFSFILVHALYTFPPEVKSLKDTKIERAFSWSGSGLLEADFYFDPFCEHCKDVYNVMKSNITKFGKINFKPVLIRPEGMDNIVRFYRLSLVEGPWVAFERVHGVRGVKGGFDPLLRIRISSFVKINRELLERLGVTGVPVVVVKGPTGYVILEGTNSVVRFLEAKVQIEKPFIELQKPVGLQRPHIQSENKTFPMEKINGNTTGLMDHQGNTAVCVPDKPCD